jgi:hypothetical protein
VSVVDQLEEFLRERRDLAGDPLAAAAAALAVDIDDPGTAANVRAACVTAFQKAMVELRALVPAEEADDKLDELAKRRAARIAGA